jgi:hypothetical protein
MIMAQVGSRRLTADIFADSHRLSTQMALRGRVLSDILNDNNTSYLELDMAYVSRIDHPGEILADYALSIVRKDRLSFVVIASGLEMALKQNQATYVYRRQWPVFVTVPYFEITGQIEAPANIDLRALMATGVERFVPVYNATATLSINQSVKFSGELILINKTSIEVLCIGDKASQ